MARNYMTTKLPAEPDNPEPTGAPVDAQRSRRRLGDWQLGGQHDAVPEFGQETGLTVQLGGPTETLSTSESDWTSPLRPNRGSRSPEPTVPASTVALGEAIVEPTTAALGADETIPLKSNHGRTGSFTERLLKGNGSARAEGFSGNIHSSPGATDPLERVTAPIASTIEQPVDRATLAPTVPFTHVTSDLPPTTAPIDGVTGRIRRRPGHSAPAATAPTLAATMPIQSKPARAFVQTSATASTMQFADPVEQTVELPTGAPSADAESDPIPNITERSNIDRLRSRITANPEDSDALFELSVMLHRAGQRAEARTVLTQLIAVYQKRGQHQQAARIETMLGAPKTGPIATEDLPPRPGESRTKSLSGRTGSLSGRAMGSSIRTDSLSGRTMALPSPTAAIGRAKEIANAKGANVHAFPPEALLFTIPLPGEEGLSKEARDILSHCEVELEQKRYLAALDSCIEVISLAPNFTPIHLRLAEIYTRQRLMRRARAQADALIRLANANNDQLALWMVYRVLLHASGGDTTSLKRLVELLIEAGQTEQASIYASRLVQILDAEGLDQAALDYSIRLCELVPGDTLAALENAILRLKAGDRGGALDRWESAVAAGANAVVAKASVAAMTSATNEDDHWRILSEILPVIRKYNDGKVVEAYVRTAAVMPESPTLVAGHGLILLAVGDLGGRNLLAQAAGARSGALISRASAAVALAWSLVQDNHIDEYVAAVRTALKFLQNETVASHPAWEGLVGRTPRFIDLSLELGETLLLRADAAGAAEVLKEAHARSRTHGPVCERLAESYFKTGQLGSALTVLDELAVHYRSAGQLEAMASVLRQMSQLAPNNIKVKSRLIEAYLQRGFVAEARAELIQRADLEERSGLIKDAVTSLQRAADLSWTIGLADETFSLYSRVVALAPDDVGNRSSLVNYYLQMGRLSEAAEHQRAVVDIAVRANHKHEAIAALHQVIGLTPDDTNAYYQLGDLLASMGEFHQAEKVYRRLVLMNAADPIAQAKATSMAALRESQAS